MRPISPVSPHSCSDDAEAPLYARMVRRRLDAAMVKRAMVESRSEASRLIAERVVTVSGALAERASRLVGDHEPIEILSLRKYVGRGGEKLAGALQNFALHVKDRSVLDAGASTGGFTDCVLQAGARRVFAVDVGTHQLHERLRADHRVVSREQTNIRGVEPGDVPFDCSLLVADLSFISLVTVLPVLDRLVMPEEGFPTPEMVLLVKPQFEVGREEVSRGRGVVTNPALHRQAVEQVTGEAARLGWSVAGEMESPLKGQDGNTEFLLHLVRPA